MAVTIEGYTVVVQKQRLADLIPVGFLGVFLDQDLPLENTGCTVAKDLFEDLAAFAIDRIVGDKNRIVVMKITVPNSRASQMGKSIVAGQF